MAELNEIQKQFKDIADEALRTERITAKQHALMIRELDRLGNSAAETANRIAELSKRSANEVDARRLLRKEIEDEIRTVRSSTRTEKEKEEAVNSIRTRTLASMKNADAQTIAFTLSQIKAAEATVRTEQRQKSFNDAISNTTNFLAPFGAAIGGLTRTLADSIKLDPLSASISVAQKELQVAGSAMSGAGGAARGAGEAISTMGKRGKYVGGVLQGLGLGLQGLGAASKLAAEAIGVIAPIIQNFQAVYKQAAEAGAIFGGGMTELRTLAGQAGVKMGDLVTGIDKGSAAFDRAGLTQSQATRMVAKFGKDIVSGSQATQLFALGFTDVQDRIALMGGAMDQARARGLSLSEAQANISNITVQYAKDLKVLQGFVGKDAEKQMEKARLEAQDSALRQKLQGDNLVAFEQTYAVLAKLPAEQGQLAQKALMQMIESGTTNIAEIRSNPAFMKALEAMAADVRAGTKEAGKAAIGNLQIAAEEAKATSGSFAGMSRARIFGETGLAAGISNFQNALMTLKFDPKTGDELQDNVNNLTGNTDQTTAAMAKINIEANKFQVALEQLATDGGAIKLFGKAMEEANAATLKLVELVKTATGSSVGSAAATGASSFLDIITSPATWGVAATAFASLLIPKVINALPGGAKAVGAATSAIGGMTGGAGGAIGSVTTAVSNIGSKISSFMGMGKEAIKAGATGLAGVAGQTTAALGTGAAGIAGATGADLAKSAGKSLLKKTPLIGGLISGALEYMEEGNIGRSLAAGLGTVVGTAVGGVGGTALMPGIGTAAGAHHFKRTTFPCQPDFEPWFDEREKAWAKLHFNIIPKHFFIEMCKHAFQMSKRDVFADHRPIDLEKLHFVCRICGFVAKHFTYRDKSCWKTPCLAGFFNCSRGDICRMCT